eukprot:1681909-Karenia_brevis.AAC.1
MVRGIHGYKRHCLLVRFSSALRFLVTSWGEIHWHHVHSHEGHPWNELVDSLCKPCFVCGRFLLASPVSHHLVGAIEQAAVHFTSFAGLYPSSNASLDAWRCVASNELSGYLDQD